MGNSEQYSRILCPECKKHVQVLASVVTLEIHHQDPARSNCRFRCPECERVIVHKVGQQDIKFLLEKGVKPKHFMNINCTTCGAVELLEASRAKVFIDHADLVHTYALYTCFNWGRLSRIDIEIGDIGLWRNCGVGIVHVNKRKDPPLNTDDLLDLHELLKEDDWFDQLVQLIDDSFFEDK